MLAEKKAMPKDKSYYKIYDKDGETPEIKIYGVIGDNWWEESISAKRFVDDFNVLEKKHEKINVRINSPGGSIWDGLPIFNAINSSKKDIHVYNDGLAASMASVIMMAVPKENRHSAKNALLMIHAPVSGVWGTAKDMRETADLVDKITNSLVVSIADGVDMEESEVREKYFDDYEDHWFTAQEAIDEGLLGEVGEEDGKVPKDVKNKGLMQLFAEYQGGFAIPKQNAMVELMTWVENIVNKINDKNKNTEDMKDSKRFANLLKIDGKSTEDEIYAAVEALANKMENTEQEKETAIQANKNAMSVIDGIDETVANAESIEDKAGAITTLINELKEAPAGGKKDLNQDGDAGHSETNKCTVSESDSMGEAINKVADEFGINI